MRNSYFEKTIRKQYCCDVFLFIEYQKAELETLAEIHQGGVSTAKKKTLEKERKSIEKKIEMAKLITQKALKQFLA